MISSEVRYKLLEETVEKLNAARDADAVSVTSFFKTMTSCDKSVGDGDIEVMVLGNELYAMHPLGLLNGVVSVNDEKGYIHRLVYFLNKGSGLITKFDIHTMQTGDLPEPEGEVTNDG